MSIRTREILLWVSLGLNAALLIGVAVLLVSGPRGTTPPDEPLGVRLLLPPGPGMDHSSGSPEVVFFVHRLDLSPDQRARAHAIFGDAMETVSHEFGHMREQRMKVIRYLVTRPSDEEGLRRLLRDGEKDHILFTQMMMERLREFAMILDEEQRDKLLEQLESAENAESPRILIRRQGGSPPGGPSQTPAP